MNQMENLQGGGWSFWAGLTCAATVAGFATFIAASGGAAIALGPLLFTSVAGSACITTLGSALQ